MLQWVKEISRRTELYLSAVSRPLSTTQLTLLALASTAIFLLLMNMEVGLYDESLMMQGAVQIGSGDVPHRDFFFTYGPMQLWVISALFSTFGKAMIVARLYDIAIRGGIVLLCGLTARRLGLRPSLVIGVMIIETFLIYASGFYLYPVLPSILCALTSTLLLIDDGSGAEVGSSRLLIAGMLTGLTALFRYDIGFLVLAAHLVTLCLFYFYTRRSIRLLIRQIFTYGIGVSLVFIPIAISAWAIGAVPGFVHDIVSFPPDNYARMRGLPWPMPSFALSSLPPLISYIPLFTSILGLAWLVRFRGSPRAMRDLDHRTKLGAALLIIMTFFIVKGYIRVSLIHSLLALIPAIVLLVFLVSRKKLGFIWVFSVAVLALAALLISLNAISVLRLEAGRGFQGLLPARIAGNAPAAMQRRRCDTPPTLGLGIVDDDTYLAACYIASHTSADEEIYVGAGRHDKLFVSNVALYYVSDRRPATHWYHLEPGLQTQADIQRRMIDDLIKSKVRLIAIDSRFDDVNEPNDSARSSGAHLLDNFIGNHYSNVARFGSITILARR